MKRLAIIAVVALALAIALLISRRETRTTSVAVSTRANPGSAETVTAAPLDPARPLRKLDPAARQRLFERIQHARATAAASTSRGAPAPTLPATAELSPDYILEQTKALAPLLHECYAAALAANPDLTGTLSISYVIDGEPGVGSVIEDSRVDAERSTITEPGMIECVRETMYALEVMPTPEGGRASFTTTLAFAPED